MPLAASPLFWWHQMVRDQDWYSFYSSMAEFDRIVGENRRNMESHGNWRLMREGENVNRRQAHGQMMHCPAKNAWIGWFYNRRYLGDLTSGPEFNEQENIKLLLPGIGEGEYSLVIWDTENGRALAEDKITLNPDTAIELPPFARDIAIYIKSI